MIFEGFDWIWPLKIIRICIKRLGIKFELVLKHKTCSWTSTYQVMMIRPDFVAKFENRQELIAIFWRPVRFCDDQSISINSSANQFMQKNKIKLTMSKFKWWHRKILFVQIALHPQSIKEFKIWRDNQNCSNQLILFQSL